jgi:hypothetical protein
MRALRVKNFWIFSSLAMNVLHEGFHISYAYSSEALTYNLNAIDQIFGEEVRRTRNN